MSDTLAGLKIDLPLEAIQSLCRKYGVQELSLFGSILRDDYDEESDVDFLVRFRDDDAGPWGVKFEEMADELSALLGRKVDLVSKGGIEKSSNYLRRDQILRSARVIYVA